MCVLLCRCPPDQKAAIESSSFELKSLTDVFYGKITDEFKTLTTVPLSLHLCVFHRHDHTHTSAHTHTHTRTQLPDDRCFSLKTNTMTINLEADTAEIALAFITALNAILAGPAPPEPVCSVPYIYVDFLFVFLIFLIWCVMAFRFRLSD